MRQFTKRPSQLRQRHRMEKYTLFGSGKIVEWLIPTSGELNLTIHTTVEGYTAHITIEGRVKTNIESEIKRGYTRIDSIRLHKDDILTLTISPSEEKEGGLAPSVHVSGILVDGGGE